MLLLLKYLIQMFRGLLGRPGGVSDTQTGSLGALVQVSVLSGAQAALEVVHDWDGSWTVSDGISDLDRPGQAVTAHLSHAALWDDSIPGLASIPPGTMARREHPTDPWRITSLTS